MFSREQYEQLRSFPEISRDELFRYFTLTPADAAFVDPGAGRGRVIGLGWLSSSRRCRGWGLCPTMIPVVNSGSCGEAEFQACQVAGSLPV
jgi:hypothetical protein